MFKKFNILYSMKEMKEDTITNILENFAPLLWSLHNFSLQYLQNVLVMPSSPSAG